jgi:microcystin-dependent protein
MATQNKGLVQPVLGSINWGTPLNDDFGDIDLAFGSTSTISVTGATATPILLSVTQYRNMIIKFDGVLTANVTYQLPAGVGGQWVMQNSTTGSFTITLASLGGGTSKNLDLGFSDIVCDGTDCAGNFGSLPSGAILIWSGSVATIPSGWLLCNGLNGTPDLRDRFVAGAGSTYAVNDTGGVTAVTLTQAGMPAHTHTFSGTVSSAGSHVHTISDPFHVHSYSQPSGSGAAPFGAVGDAIILAGTSASFTGVTLQSAGSHSHTYTGVTSSFGGGGSHDNMPPYLALCYIMKV